MRRWLRIVTFLVLLGLLAGLLTPAQAAPPAATDPTAAANRAITWLLSQRNADGGFGKPQSAPGTTADALLALGAVGQAAPAPALDYLTRQRPAIEKSAGLTAKVILALTATGQDPRRFAGLDLVAHLRTFVDPQSGRLGQSAIDHAYALLALAATDRAAITPAMVTWLLRTQLPEGAWAWDGDQQPGSGDTNTTALAVQALARVGGEAARPAIDRALQYFRTVQNDDGGFPFQKPAQLGTETDANSTALVLQALLASGQRPEAWARPQGNPLTALLALQNPSGAFRWKAGVPEDNLLATVQAVPALVGQPLPIVRPAPAPAPVTPTRLPRTGAPVALPVLIGMALVLSGRVFRRSTTCL